MPDSLPAAFYHHASRSPEEPWLFHPVGWDWRWLSWREAAERVELWRRALAGVAAGTRVAFAAPVTPRTVLLDLALQSAGLVALPLSSGHPTADPTVRRAELWVDPGLGLGPAPHRLPWLTLPAGSDPGPRGRPGSPPVLSGPASGGGVVTAGEELAAGDLVAAAAELGGLLARADRRPGEREILVSCRPLSDPLERRLLAWATVTGAALVLDPDRATGAATAAWARPTIFRGDAGELAALRAAAGRRRPWRRRLPFGRLHTIVLDGELAGTEREYWEERGVRLITPQCGARASAVV